MVDLGVFVLRVDNGHNNLENNVDYDGDHFKRSAFDDLK